MAPGLQGPSEPAKAAIGQYITVFDYPDGRLSIRHNGIGLAYRAFDKVRQVDQGAIAEQAARGSIGMIRDKQLRRGARASQWAAPAPSARRASVQNRLSSSTSRASDARSVEQRVRCELRTIGRRSGAALRWGSGPARRPTRPLRGDICKWQRR